MGTGEGHISVTCFCCIWHSNYTRYCSYCYHLCYRYRDGRERMVVRFTSTCAISAYCHKSCDFKSCSWRGIPDRTCDKICQWLATGWLFYQGTPVSSTNKTDCLDVAEILLKVVLNTINQTIPIIDIHKKWK